MRPIRTLLARLFGTSAASVPSAVQADAGGEVITGIVHPHGAGGGRTPPATLWKLRFTLEEWRGADGVIRTTPLSVHSEWEHGAMSAAMNRINASRVVTLRVRFTGDGSAELLEVLTARLPPDDPLWVRAIELSKPVTREDEAFGTLQLNRGLGWWEVTATWAGETVDLQLSAEDEAGLEATLATARALWEDEAGWSERIQAFAVQELLPLKNDSWLGEDEEPLTPAAFRARMRLDAITVYPDGEFTFWHDDGDLFWGHSIQVNGTLLEGPTDADIPG